MYHLDSARRLHRPLAGAAHHTSAAALGLDRRGHGPADRARHLVAPGPARGPALGRIGARHRGPARARAGAALRRRRDGRRHPRHHHRRRHLLRAAAQRRRGRRSRRDPRVRLPGSTAAAQPRGADRPHADLDAALPAGHRRRCARSRRRRLARTHRPGPPGPRPALRARGAALVVRRGRRWAVGVAAAPAHALCAGRGPDRRRAALRRHAALLVHGLRAVDDPRGVVRLRSAVCRGQRPLGAGRRHPPSEPGARRPHRPGLRGAVAGGAVRATAGAARAGRSRALARASAPRLYAGLLGLHRRTALPAAASPAQLSPLHALRLQAARPGRLLQPLAVTLARHAVFVVARLLLVDAGGLRGGARHGRLPAA